VPSRGDKLKLLQLSTRNATSFKLDSIQAKEKEASKYEKKDRTLLQLKEDLRLRDIPEVIECFDNSNIQGFEPVASCVVFRNGKPSKRDYRHFNVKTVIGPNDFASMSEIVFRRYKRMLEEEGALPNLIIVDGGKGQLGAAVQSLKQLGVYGKVSIIGIAKRLEEIYVPEDPIPIYINKASQSLRLIQRIRDEAHRFGITFHRNKRSNTQLKSAFENIPGIGEKTVEKILKAESDVEVLKKYSMNELTELFGKRTANILNDFLRNH
jgi:excinuclease ABC subunit C